MQAQKQCPTVMQRFTQSFKKEKTETYQNIGMHSNLICQRKIYLDDRRKKDIKNKDEFFEALKGKKINISLPETSDFFSKNWEIFNPRTKFFSRSNSNITLNEILNDFEIMNEYQVNNAISIMEKAKIVNYTDPRHYLFDEKNNNPVMYSVANSSFTKRDNIKNHIVNKWERSEDGELYLGRYDKNSRESNLTNNKEARFLGSTPKAYSNLPSYKKMQFGMMDLPNKNVGKVATGGFGNSAFVIKKSKAKKDGKIHFGDSNITCFSLDPIHYFNKEKLKKVLKSKLKWVSDINNKTISSWIEVDFANGVMLPDDIEKLVIDPKNYAFLVDLYDGDEDNLKTTLTLWLGENGWKKKSGGWE